MRYQDILAERAATERGASKYVSPKTGAVFYITHREPNGGEVVCEARVAGTTAYQPLRALAGRVICTMHDRPHDPGRNGVRCIVYKAAIEPEFWRQSVYSAMLDHLETYGYIVYGANGEIGNPVLQTQSDLAKAFWQDRRSRRSTVKLSPVSEAEVHGFGRYNPFAHAAQVAGLPVLEEVDASGYQYPLLVLWQKAFARGMQQVGVIYDPERGYKAAVRVDDPRWGQATDTFFTTDGDLSFYHRWMAKVLKSSTVAMIHKVGDLIEQERRRDAERQARGISPTA